MKQNLRVGLVFLGALLLLYFILVWGKQSLWLQSYTTYKVHFENVNGLKVADPVLIRGLQVGSVRNIIIRDTFCEVTIQIAPEYTLPNLTTAEIQIKELLAGKQLVLFPKGNTPLKPQEPIQGKPTFDFSIGLSEIGNLFFSIKKDFIDNQKLTEVFKRIDTLFHSPILTRLPEQFHDLLGSMQSILVEFKQRHMLINLDSVLQNLHALSKDLPALRRDVDSLIIEARQSFKPVPNTLTQLDSTLNHTQALLKTFQQDYQLVKNNKAMLNAFMFDEIFFHDLQQTLKNLNQTLEQIQKEQIYVTATIGKRKKTAQTK